MSETPTGAVDEADLKQADDEDEVTTEDQIVERADDAKERHFPCHQCGADLEWKAGAESLTCPYCGHREELPQDEAAIREFAFNDYLADTSKERGLGTEARSLRCGGCGAHTELSPEITARECPFCGGSLVDDDAHDERIRPEAIVPFKVERDAARTAFRKWLRKRWFAPNGLADEADADRLAGIYRPWWTFDSHTMSHWSGQAGYYYYVTRTRTVNGKTQTYRQRKTRWVRRSGIYEQFFDDTLVPGFSGELTPDDYRLSEAETYRTEFIAGYVAERYAKDPQASWPDARADMEAAIRKACKSRLGGDTQRALHVDTAHSGITFKSILLPAWHSTYRYRDKTYRLVVNGQTGAVRAERPWSWIKLTAAGLVAAVIIGLIVFVVIQAQQSATL